MCDDGVFEEEERVMTVRVGLVGFGYAGATLHAPLIRAASALRLAMVATSKPAEVTRLCPDVECVSDAGALIAVPGIDVVVLATPNLSHFPLAEQALRAGKHVVIDKPMVVDSLDGDKLIALARRQNRVLTVFHNRRWDGDFLTVRSLLQSRSLGEVRDFESRFDRYRPEVRVRWREDELPGSGLLYDLGSHLIDQALLLFGRPRRVFADLRRERIGAKATDAFDLILDYDRHRARLRAGMLVAAPSARFRIDGDRGGFVKYGSDPQEDQLKRGDGPGDESWGDDHPDMFGAMTLRDGDKTTELRLDTTRGAYEKFYDELAQSIEHGSSPPVDAMEANNVIRLVEAAIRSHQEGRWIETN